MKKFTVILLALAMLLSLSACGAEKTETGTAAPAEQGFTPALDTDTAATLNFVGNWGNFEALDQVALDFQKVYPNVEVIYTYLGDYRNDLANRFATGEEVDLFMAAWWDTEYTLNQNIIDNAEDLNASGIDFSNLNAELLASGQANGAQTVVPVYLTCWGAVANLDLLESAGVAVPSTWQELLDACAALAGAGYEQPIYVNSSQYGRTFTGYYMLRRIAGSDELTALDETVARADELAAAGYVSAEGDTLEDNYNAMILRFFEGDIPFMPISTSNYSGTAKREAKSEAFTATPFRYTFIPMSYDESGRALIDQLGTVYVGVYKNSANLELANEFLRFLLTDEEMLVLETVKNMPTANSSNGMDLFPYLKSAQLFYNSEDGISSLDEERAINVLGQYSIGGDHSAMTEKMNEYLEKGIN